jgi:propanol-preferring alcohol dehydrogenase
MKAMVLRENKPIEESPLILEEVPEPRPGPHEVRVKVRACGICRTDLHVIEGELSPVRSLLIPGHQIVGVVDRLGEKTSRFQVGDRLGIAWLRWTCGRCAFCREGLENLCEQSQFTGYHADGGFAEYALVHEDFAYPLPGIFDDREATPLLCAGIIGYRALRRSQLKPGQRLGIYGFGSSAHILIQIARYRACPVYVCTRGEKHRELARRLGATWVGKAAQQMPVKVHSAIVFAPVGELVPVALKSLRKGGTLSLAGITMTPIPVLDYQECLFYERNVHSVTANTRQDGLDLLREAAEIPIRPRTQLFGLEEANCALQLLKADQIGGTGVLVVENQ